MCKISIIIVNYNSLAYLKKALVSINQNNKLSIEIIVMDNASPDDFTLLSIQFPQINFINNPVNEGFAKANNQGIELAQGKYLMLLNPDTELRNDALQIMFDHMDSNPEVGACGPKLFNSDETLQQSARAFPSIKTAFFGRTTVFTKLFPDNKYSKQELLGNDPERKKPQEVDWISGACLMVSREAIKSAGLLDDEYFMYWEDTDWCKRIKDKGFKVIWVPAAEVFHHVGQSSKSLKVKTTLAFHNSAFRYYKKHCSKNPFILSLVYVLLMGRAWLKIFFKALKIRKFFTLLKAKN